MLIFRLIVGLVGSHFDEEGENIKGDVNGDGTVDISDLVLVGSHLGETSPPR